MLRSIAGGEKLDGFLVDFLEIREAAKGTPIGFAFPEEGVSAVTKPVAILSSARSPDAPRAFGDFPSPAGRQRAADMGYPPAHPAITPPKGFPPVSDIRRLDVDAAAALAGDVENKKRFADRFGG